VDKKVKNILVVDDDEFILRTIKEVLQLEGYSVNVAETGKEALEKSKTHYYNLALIDIKLPDIEGTKLLDMFEGHSPKMMKVIVTGFPTLDNAVDALNRGADAYVMKPIKAEKLLKIVDQKLTEQEEAEKISQEKVKRWIETRVKKLMANTNAKL
jgi:DNA-binding NtrC family response regulator